MTNKITELSHPLIQHKLSIMRQKDTSTAKFRTLSHEIAMLMAYEISSDLELSYKTIETPLAKMEAPFIDGKKSWVSLLKTLTSSIIGKILKLFFE